MSFLLSVAISIGILAGIWGEVSGMFGLVTFAGFIAWASFYASGGGEKGLIKTLPANFVGIILGFVIAYGSSALSIPFASGVVTAIVCFVIVMQSKWEVLSFIPGTFAGTATFFGSNLDLKGTIIAMVLGGLLGYVSEIGGKYLSKITSGPKDPLEETGG